MLKDVAKARAELGLVLCVGSSKTEDALFALVEQMGVDDPSVRTLTASVGQGRSSATHYVESVSDAVLLLSSLV